MDSLLGILGLIASFTGTYLAYVTFINPSRRLNWYLKDPQNWEKVFKENNLTYYRCKKHAGFAIEVDWNKPVINNFKEDWISHYPDIENNSSYLVALYANGVYISKELFVSIDGGRGFVPVPKRDGKEYYYSRLQTNLARIISEFPTEKSIEDFAKKQKIPISFV